NCLSSIPFKSQLSDLSYEGTLRWSLCVDLHQHLSRFFQVTLSLINARFCFCQIGIVWDNIQRTIVQLQRGREFPKHGIVPCRVDQYLRVARIEGEGLLEVCNAFVPVPLALGNQA